MWIKWVEWRLDYQPHKVKRKDIKHTTFRKCLYVGKDFSLGCPCVMIKPGATNDTYTVEELEIVIAYVLEKASKIADKNGSTQLCVIFDRTGMNNSLERKWLPIYKEMSSMIQDFYPERLRKAYVLHLNWFGRLMYNICKPFIAKRTMRKVSLLVRLGFT